MTGEALARAGAVEQAAALLGGRARLNEPLGGRTTYKTGGPASLWVDIDDEDDLAAVVEAVKSTSVPVLVMGRGSNLLVSDEGWSGLAITLGGPWATLRIEGDQEPVEGAAGVVWAGAAVALPVLARQMAAVGWRGMEWSVGVPGSVGGAVRMNAGGHGSELKSHLLEAEVCDLATGERTWWSPDRLAQGTRTSAIQRHHLVLAARLRVVGGNAQDAGEEISSIVRWRREHQPGGRNAGSVFKNPPGLAAGRLVEQAGWKGRSHASATVSDKHANFIVAADGGSSSDVRSLIEAVRNDVGTRMGVWLEPEVDMVGFETDDGDSGE